MQRSTFRIAFIIFVVNCGLLATQLVAGRLFAPFIGSSLTTWTSVIGVILAGIAAGNWLGGHLADRRPRFRTLAAVLACGGATTLLALPLARLIGRTG